MGIQYSTEKSPETATQDDGRLKIGLELFARMLKVCEDATATNARLETAISNVGKAAVVDAHPPAAVAEKTETVGTTKGKLNAISTTLLGILAGVFIGFGAMFYTVVTTDTGLGFGLNKLLGGVVFCLGLILVVVAGAELFTGNTLIAMSWLSGRTSFGRLARNWGLVYVANFIGSLSLVGLMYFTVQWAFAGNAVGANALAIANAKVNLSFGTALARGILCNALVCLAIWLCFSARTVTDKILAIIFPITAFVAAGFEHSIANMYFIPMGILLSGEAAVVEAAAIAAGGLANLTWAGFVGNLVPVTIGNIIGGGILIGAVYWLTYLRSQRATEMYNARPWLGAIFPSVKGARVEESAPAPLAEPVRTQIEDLIRNRNVASSDLDNSGKALIDVLARARDDNEFLARLSENPAQTLKDYGLTSEERAALSSGDINWLESRLGVLDEPLRTWLTAKLSQEKW
jgi:formate/nitrite transporter